MVERLPDGGWDWVVWLARAPASACQGCASTEGAAFRAAEHASERLVAEGGTIR